jgi:hypothetical protein
MDDALLAQASVDGSGRARLEVGDAGDELDGALASEEIVVGHARDGDHREAAVLDLGQLAAGICLGVLLEAEGVESNVTGAVNGAVGELEKEGDLKEADEPEHLPEGAGLDGGLVEAPHLLALIPLAHEGEGVKVLHDGAGGGEHADAAVLDLSLAGPDHVTDGAEDAAVDSPVSPVNVPVVAIGVREALHGQALGGLGRGRAGGAGGEEGRRGEGRSRAEACESEDAAVHGDR